jgi:hypothetical protein
MNTGYLKFSFVSTVLVLIMAALFMTTGCVTAPETLRERLVDAYSKHSAVATTVAYGLETGVLTKQEGQEALTSLRRARLSLDGARVLMENDPATAEGRINLAMTALIKLRDQLNQQGVSTP